MRVRGGEERGREGERGGEGGEVNVRRRRSSRGEDSPADLKLDALRDVGGDINLVGGEVNVGRVEDDVVVRVADALGEDLGRGRAWSGKGGKEEIVVLVMGGQEERREVKEAEIAGEKERKGKVGRGREEGVCVLCVGGRVFLVSFRFRGVHYCLVGIYICLVGEIKEI